MEAKVTENDKRKKQSSPVPGSGHALAFSSFKALLIRRRGGVTAVNGVFLHSKEVQQSEFSAIPLLLHIPHLQVSAAKFITTAMALIMTLKMLLKSHASY